MARVLPSLGECGAYHRDNLIPFAEKRNEVQPLSAVTRDSEEPCEGTYTQLCRNGNVGGLFKLNLNVTAGADTRYLYGSDVRLYLYSL
jgi:hypothetical protein